MPTFNNRFGERVHNHIPVVKPWQKMRSSSGCISKMSRRGCASNSRKNRKELAKQPRRSGNIFREWEWKREYINRQRKSETESWEEKEEATSKGHITSTKHQILLPINHHLLVHKAHNRVLYNGTKGNIYKAVLKILGQEGQKSREKNHIPVRLEQKTRGTAIQCTPTTTTPWLRVKEVPPFSYTGVDFAGPLYVNSDGSST